MGEDEPVKYLCRGGVDGICYAWGKRRLGAAPIKPCFRTVSFFDSSASIGTACKSITMKKTLQQFSVLFLVLSMVARMFSPCLVFSPTGSGCFHAPKTARHTLPVNEVLAHARKLKRRQIPSLHKRAEAIAVFNPELSIACVIVPIHNGIAPPLFSPDTDFRPPC